MVISRSESIFFITIGGSTLVLSAIPFIVGCIGLSMLNFVSVAEAIVGFGSLYFIAPGVLSLLSGYKQGRAVLGATLATNIIGILMAVSCMSTSAVYVAVWSNLSCREDDYYDEYDSYGNRVHYDGNSDDAECSNLTTGQSLAITNTVAFTLLTIISFTGSIFGCATTCCTAENYIPVSSQSDGANELVVTTSNAQSSQSWSQQPPAYRHEHHQQGPSIQNSGNTCYVYSNDKDCSGNELLNV